MDELMSHRGDHVRSRSPADRERTPFSSGDGMIEQIVPPEVVGVEAFDDPPDAVLYPEEEAVISRAVGKRQREFRTVRHCARRALHELGVPPTPLLPGERGMPLWPAEAVGSMTHCTGYRAAAVARSSDVLAIGIDAEPHEALPSKVLDYLAVGEERRRLTELAAAAGEICWDRVLFCIKETVYKAWFPLTRTWLGFDDAVVTITPSAAPPTQGDFSARLQVDGPSIAGEPVPEFSGRWVVRDGLVLAAASVNARSGPFRS